MARPAGRTVLAAAIVAAAALVSGVALTAALSLSGGFERAADRADLPDLIIRFGDEPRAEVERRLGALPNLEAQAYRTELRRFPLRANGRSSHRGAVHIVQPGRRGYAIVEGRDVRGGGEVVVEQGVARAWDLGPGDQLELGHRDSTLRIVGVSLSPDNVAFPLAAAPRVYVDRDSVPRGIPVNIALAWLRNPAREDVVLTQARAVAFGLDDLRFVTRAGVQVLVGQAAGIVIALLVGFSLVAVLTSGVMLAASARSEVARRLPAIGVERALGFSRRDVVAGQARRAALLAAPAAAAGLLVGWLVVRGPSERLLEALNEVGPGARLLLWLALAWLAIVALVAAAAAWPVWRATGGPVAVLLRGGELATGRPRRRRRGALPRLALLGVRLALARRGRWSATVAVLAAASATVVLLLALASLLVALRDDPATVGKRYSLTVALGEEDVPAVRALEGVAAATPRWEVDASAAYALGQPLRLVALPRGAGGFETPPLAEGRRRRGAGEVEVGAGLADALGLRPGSTFAAALPSGGEARFRVAGVVRAIENEGRIAYVRSDRLEEMGALGAPEIAVRLEPGADRAAVTRGLERLGAPPARAGAATTRDQAFLGILAAVLRIVALTVAAVCTLVLAQALVVTARERRATLALLRTVGAGRDDVLRVLGGACAAVLLPAVALGVLLEALVLGPAVAALAAGYAGLSLTPTAGQVVLAGGGLAVFAAIAVALVARRVEREPIVAGLREEA